MKQKEDRRWEPQRTSTIKEGMVGKEAEGRNLIKAGTRDTGGKPRVNRGPEVK